MARPNEIHVYFAVFGFGDDPSAVTKIIGVEPTRAWIKGGQVPGQPPGGRGTHERWVLESRLRTASIEEQIADLLPQLEERADAIQGLAKRFKVAFRVAGYFYDTFNPSWEMSADVVRRLAALNLLVDFDIYCLGEDDEM